MTKLKIVLAVALLRHNAATCCSRPTRRGTQVVCVCAVLLLRSRPHTQFCPVTHVPKYLETKVLESLSTEEGLQC